MKTFNELKQGDFLYAIYKDSVEKHEIVNIDYSLDIISIYIKMNNTKHRITFNQNDIISNFRDYSINVVFFSDKDELMNILIKEINKKTNQLLMLSVL